jgi:hypothetical protein
MWLGDGLAVMVAAARRLFVDYVRLHCLVVQRLLAANDGLILIC